MVGLKKILAFVDSGRYQLAEETLGALDMLKSPLLKFAPKTNEDTSLVNAYLEASLELVTYQQAISKGLDAIDFVAGRNSLSRAWPYEFPKDWQNAPLKKRYQHLQRTSTYQLVEKLVGASGEFPILSTINDYDQKKDAKEVVACVKADLDAIQKYWNL